MSTDLQLKGDSRRRQLDASRQYAEANELDLAQDAELEDIGVSAYTGANVRDGALGRFLEAVRAGTIKRGSYLIVESLDRLSREQVLTAQSLFLSIIQAGINLVTLMDGKVYQAGKVDLADLITSLVIMSRAHEESAAKSRRIGAAWKNKRSEAGRTPMTKWCPAWLTLAPDRSGYLPIPKRVEIVRQIFRDTADGIGMYSIANQLNKAKVPTFGGPNGWHQSYVAKILSNRAVLGEFQPHLRSEGRRVAVGEPVPNYYPAVIDDGLFHQAQLGKAQRRGSGAGRKGVRFTNLFSGIARCFYCSAPILFENKGDGPKGGKYLICGGAKRGLRCPSIRWRYADFEATFLAFVEELDVDALINEGSRSERKHLIEGELSALQGELVTVNNLMEKTYDMLGQEVAVAFVTRKLAQLEERRITINGLIESKATERDEIVSRHIRYSRSKEEITQLVERLQSPGDDELFKLRAQIASQLRALVDTLLVGSSGEQPRAQAIMQKLETTGQKLEDTDDTEEFKRVTSHIEQVASRPEQSRRFFAASFRDSSVRVVFPNVANPLQFEQQVIADAVWGLQNILPDPR